MVFNLRNAPGFTATIESEESCVYFGGRQGQTQLSERAVMIGSDAVDSGNVPTTSLRGGLVMIEDSSGLYYPYGQTGKTGPIRGILPFTIDMVIDNLAEERWCQLFISGLIKTDELLNAGRAEYNALAKLGFILDDTLAGDTVSRGFFQTIQAGDANYSASARDYSCLIVVANASTSRTVALPPIDEGGFISVMFGAAGGDITSFEGDNLAGDSTDDNDAVTVGGLSIVELMVVKYGTADRWVVLNGSDLTFS